MSDDMRRLLDGPADPRIAHVLAAGLADEPSAHGMRRNARALGIAALTSASAAKAATGAHAGLKSALLAITKWFAAGILLGGVSASPLIVRKATEPSRAPAVLMSASPIEARVARVAAAVPAAPVDSGNEVPPATTSESSPRVAPTLRAPAVPTTVEPAPPGASVATFEATPKSSLDSEIQLLDTARRALKRGDPNATLAALDRYEQNRSAHTLGAEATLLRVQALMASGRSGEARAIAQRALEARSSDGYACRLAKLAGLTPDACPAR